MTFAEQALVAVVLLVGVPSAMKNRTAAGLVLAWLIMESVWRATGEVSSTILYVLADFTVLAVIYMKDPAYNCLPYRSFGHQLCALWWERSWWDRFIIACFPAAWALYTFPPDSPTRWWGLYWLAIGQFLAAGGEAIQNWLSGRAANVADAVSDALDNPSSRRWFLKLAWGWAGDG